MRNNLLEKSILIVDDEEGILDVIGGFLQRLGYKKVYLALNGEEALKILNIYSIDIIITDINMPVCNGNELVDEIRKKDKYFFTPIIVATGYPSRENRISLLYSVDLYLVKPISLDELHLSICSLLGRYKFLEKNFDLEPLCPVVRSNIILKQRMEENLLLKEKLDRETEKLRLRQAKYDEKIKHLKTKENELDSREQQILNRAKIIGLASFEKETNSIKNEQVLHTQKLPINSEEITKFLSLMNELFSISRHDLYNTSSNLSYILISYSKLIQKLKSDNPSYCFDEFDRLYKKFELINKRFVTQIKVLMGKRLDKDLDNILTTCPYKIVQNLKNHFYKISIEIDRYSLKTFEFLFPSILFASIIDELLINAEKHIKAPVKVYLQWKIRHRIFTFSYHDNGTGITKELDKIPCTIEKLKKKKTGGLTIIDTAMNRIEGYMLFSRSKKLSGTRIDLAFPISKYYKMGKLYEVR